MGVVPIRKTAPDTVALTTFYGKNFVRRADRVANNYTNWLQNQITVRGIDVKDNSITELRQSNVFDQTKHLPRDYSILSQRISSFNADGYHYNFDIKKVDELFGKEVVDELSATNLVPLAKSIEDILVMDGSSVIYRRNDEGMSELGKLHELLDISAKMPLEYSELSLMGKAIPLAIIFGYYLGLERTLKYFGAKYQIVDRGARTKDMAADLVIPCRDGKYVITYSDIKHEMLFNGWSRYLKVTKDYTVEDLNKPDVYLPLIQKDGLTLRYLNELTLMDDMFVDPISERILKKMGEPLTFKGLLERSNELLTTDWHPDEMDAKYQHMFTTHRIPGTVYTNLVRATREFRGKNGIRRKIDIAPNAIWKDISSDGSVMTASDANPIHSIKEVDVVTLSGTGGRSKRSMVKHTRKYTENDIGWISGDTVDSGDVSITAYMVSNPKVGDVDGLLEDYEREGLEMSQYMSLPVLLAPGSMYDDGKRKNFVGIQHGSGTSGAGYEVSPYRTGAEKVVAHRTNSSQATVAEDEGVVVEVSDSRVVVEYQNGTTKTYPVGRSFGRHEGAVFPRTLTSNVKVGQKFSKGTILTYNEKFFEPDWHNKEQVNWKAGAVMNTALIEGNDTFEDSSAISERASGLLMTEVTKVENIFVQFDQAIRDLVKIGQKVDDDSILCIIEDALTANTGLFNDESMSTLRNLSAQMPEAKVRGRIDHIEIFYNGDMEDMSDSVRAIAIEGDKRRKRAAAASTVVIADTGKVDSSLRIEGQPVELDTMVIRVYLTYDSPAIGGDKAVFANQMKTTFRRVLVGENRTDSGEDLDAIFGRASIDNRIVLSVYRIGTGIKFSQLLSSHISSMIENS